MANIIAVVNQKGGVGKTTTTVNITAALRALGKRVLLCDFDAQANATSGMGVDKNTASPNVYDVLINGAEPQKAVVSTKYGDVLPSNKALAGASIEMIAIPDREHLLQKALEQLVPNYDYIFIDCPPLWRCLPSTPCAPPAPCWSRCSASITPWRASATCWPRCGWSSGDSTPSCPLRGCC